MNAHLPELDRAVEIIVRSMKNGGKLLVCGNGGSAADSAHIVGELVKGFIKRRPLPPDWAEALGSAPLQMGLPAIDLTAQSALLTAVGNDLGSQSAFAQQVLAYGAPGDVLLGISTSGNAGNVCLAARAARLKGMTVVALTGADGGPLGGLADVTVRAPVRETYQVQEYHVQYYHELCARVEAAFFAV